MSAESPPKGCLPLKKRFKDHGHINQNRLAHFQQYFSITISYIQYRVSSSTFDPIHHTKAPVLSKNSRQENFIFRIAILHSRGNFIHLQVFFFFWAHKRERKQICGVKNGRSIDVRHSSRINVHTLTFLFSGFNKPAANVLLVLKLLSPEFPNGSMKQVTFGPHDWQVHWKHSSLKRNNRHH